MVYSTTTTTIHLTHFITYVPMYYPDKQSEYDARLNAGWINENHVSLSLRREGHRCVNPELLRSRTKGSQSDAFDFIGFHESIGTYLADVKGLEELASYQSSGWNPNVGLLNTYKAEGQAHAEREDNPSLSLIRVTRSNMFNKEREYKNDAYRSFLVPPSVKGQAPEFCIEVPWSSSDDWIGPYKYDSIYPDQPPEEWYGIEPDHPSLIVHDWLDEDKIFPRTDTQVEFKDPIKLMARMIMDLSTYKI